MKRQSVAPPWSTCDSRGYHVIEAKDGLDALMAATKYVDAIDLLITDVVMPNMSGGELAKELAHLSARDEIFCSFPDLLEKPCSITKS